MFNVQRSIMNSGEDVYLKERILLTQNSTLKVNFKYFKSRRTNRNVRFAHFSHSKFESGWTQIIDRECDMQHQMKMSETFRLYSVDANVYDYDMFIG